MIQDSGGTATSAAEKLRAELERYPPARIISVSMMSMTAWPGVELIAIVETI